MTTMGEHFDDLEVGMTFDTGRVRVTEEDVLRFAAEFDPQPFHLDHAVGAASPFNGLAASGWHTAAILMRLIVDAKPFGRTPILGLGVDELRWLAPVKPGDELRVRGEILSLTPSASRPDRGTARIRMVARNQRDEAVYSIIPILILPRRAA
jgi:acyl dehydratase